MASSAVQHYRLSMLGQDLKDTIEELVENDLFDKEHEAVVWEHFDRIITDTLSKEVKTKATIRGAIKHYRNHDDIWTIFLNTIELRFPQEGKAVESDAKTEMIAVSKR